MFRVQGDPVSVCVGECLEQGHDAADGLCVVLLPVAWISAFPVEMEGDDACWHDAVVRSYGPPTQVITNGNVGGHAADLADVFEVGHGVEAYIGLYERIAQRVARGGRVEIKV